MLNHPVPPLCHLHHLAITPRRKIRARHRCSYIIVPMASCPRNPPAATTQVAPRASRPPSPATDLNDAAASAGANATSGITPASSPYVSHDGNGATFAVGQRDGPLAAIAKTAPVYPPAAQRRNIEGWSKVTFLVDEQGQVDRVSILAAEPEGIFDQEVLRCISGWRFRPGTKGGVAVEALVEQTITCKLEG